MNDTNARNNQKISHTVIYYIRLNMFVAASIANAPADRSKTGKLWSGQAPGLFDLDKVVNSLTNGIKYFRLFSVCFYNNDMKN